MTFRFENRFQLSAISFQPTAGRLKGCRLLAAGFWLSLRALVRFVGTLAFISGVHIDESIIRDCFEVPFGRDKSDRIEDRECLFV